jgi:hypothetical protein
MFQNAISGLLDRNTELCEQVEADDEEVDILEKQIFVIPIFQKRRNQTRVRATHETSQIDRKPFGSLENASILEFSRVSDLERHMGHPRARIKAAVA